MRTLRIAFTVSENDAGSILADLADRVQNLDFGVINEVPHHKNAPRRSKGINGTGMFGVIMKACKTEQTTTSLKDALNKAGFSPHSLNNALFKLRKAKQIKNLAKGIYIATGKQ